MKAGIYQDLSRSLTRYGLIMRGGFVANGDDEFLKDARVIFLVGNAGSKMFQAFRASGIKGENALDRWTQMVVAPIVKAHRLKVIYPFDGPPYAPFQRWAMRSQSVSPSPPGLLLHPEYGLWHAYRAAIICGDMHLVPQLALTDHPCESCADEACMKACPVAAFGANGYDVDACRHHLAGADKENCMQSGCAARRACPVGQDYTYHPAHAAFHMRAFL